MTEKCAWCLRPFRTMDGKTPCDCTEADLDERLAVLTKAKLDKAAWLAAREERVRANGSFSPWVFVSPQVCFRHNPIMNKMATVSPYEWTVSGASKVFIVRTNDTTYFDARCYGSFAEACVAFDTWAINNDYTLQSPNQAGGFSKVDGVEGVWCEAYHRGFWLK